MLVQLSIPSPWAKRSTRVLASMSCCMVGQAFGMEGVVDVGAESGPVDGLVEVGEAFVTDFEFEY